MLVGSARAVLRDIDEATAAMRGAQGLRGGRVDLDHHAVAGHGAADHDPDGVRRDHPDVTVNAEAGFTPEEVLAGVRSGACEIGILGSRRAHPRARISTS